MNTAECFGNARWISYCNGYVGFPLENGITPYIRKDFYVKDEVKRATLAICGLGLYRASLNGSKVTDAVLTPLFTNYNERALYDEFDVTRLVTQGKNCLGVVLGNGFYLQSVHDVWQFEYASWKGVVKVIFRIVIEYESGETEDVVSDTAAKWSKGPIVYNEIRCGEHYDARLENVGWDKPGYNDEKWEMASVTKPAPGRLRRNSAPLIRPFREYSSKVILSEGRKTVYDFGQNMAGFISLSGSAAPGTELTVRYSELTDPDGNINTKQIKWLVYSDDFQTDKYIFGDRGAVNWSPSFAYHGFRYAEITGTGEYDITVKAVAISSDFNRNSVFECSDEYLSRLYEITDMSDRSNYVGIPTDCPHREKNGWMSEGLLSADRIIGHYDAISAYEKWLDDMVDSMRPSGELPAVVPTPAYGYLWGNGPTYDYALHKIPWLIYRETGNTEILKKYYEYIKRSVKYLEYFLNDDLALDYGLYDWLSVDIYNPCPLFITSTSYFFSSCVILSRIAGLLGDSETKEYYAELSEKIKCAFNSKFVDPETGKVGSDVHGVQTAQCVPLFYGIISDGNRARVLNYLKEAVHGDNGHISTGTYGTHCILEVLAANGMFEEAYGMVQKRDFPGWGFMLEKGATTLWEMWNAGRDEEWYGSLNHNVYGSVVDFIERYVAGVRQADGSAGWSHAVIQPAIWKKIGSIGIERETVKGTLSVKTEYDPAEKTTEMSLKIPDGCTATIILPDGMRDGVPSAVKHGEYRFRIKNI
ncbi:MAG: family 78 glycoside hydrolase catalytic domain [Clostridia bacterium]|nr:family 78 glycoside hydrolase catalytic domain [Clostridia bacterium]